MEELKIIKYKGESHMKKTKIQRLLVVIVIMFIVSLQVTVPAAAKSKGYKFTYEKATVYMGGPAKKILKKAGKPRKVKVAKSCAYDGKDRTYRYKDIIIYTYSNTDDGPEYINGITFLNSNVSTKEGISIGSSYSEVSDVYGEKSDYLGIYTYKKGPSKLQFQITDGIVKNIRYIKA